MLMINIFQDHMENVNREHLACNIIPAVIHVWISVGTHEAASTMINFLALCSATSGFSNDMSLDRPLSRFHCVSSKTKMQHINFNSIY